MTLFEQTDLGDIIIGRDRCRALIYEILRDWRSRVIWNSFKTLGIRVLYLSGHQLACLRSRYTDRKKSRLKYE